MKYSSLFSERL